MESGVARSSVDIEEYIARLREKLHGPGVVGDGGAGVLNQSGGTHTVSTYLALGSNLSGAGTVNLSGAGAIRLPSGGPAFTTSS